MDRGQDGHGWVEPEGTGDPCVDEASQRETDQPDAATGAGATAAREGRASKASGSGPAIGRDEVEALAATIAASGAGDAATPALDAPEATGGPGAGVTAGKTAPASVMGVETSEGEGEAPRANPEAPGATAGAANRVRARVAGEAAGPRAVGA